MFVNADAGHTIYFVVNRKMKQVASFDSAANVAAHMLGRNIPFYVIIKSTSDAQGRYHDKLVNNPSSDVKHLELQLELV